MLALTLFAPAVLNDGDSFWHLAAGDWIIAHRAVPRTDPFSYTFAGAPWVAHEWLSEVLMAAAFRAAGWSGVVVLTALAAALAFFQLARHLGRWLAAGPSLLLLLLAGSCIASNLDAARLWDTLDHSRAGQACSQAAGRPAALVSDLRGRGGGGPRGWMLKRCA